MKALIENKIDFSDRKNEHSTWQVIEEYIGYLVGFLGKDELPARPYINSLVMKYFRLANEKRNSSNLDYESLQTKLSMFLSQIVNIIPYMETNAPLPLKFKKPIVH